MRRVFSRLPAADLIALGVLAAVALWTAHAFLRAGAFPVGHDVTWHTVRLAAFDVAIREGHIPPQWAGAFYHGYGGPVFAYYPSLLYYLTEPLLLLGGGILLTWRVMVVAVTILTAWLMYGWWRGPWGRVGALVSAGAVTLAPYHLLDLYVRAAYTEYAAFPCAIGMLWAAHTWARSGRRVAWFALVIATAAMVGLHLGSIVMLGPLTAAWLVALLAGRHTNWRRLLGGWAALAAALALTVGDWMPAFMEKDLVRIDQETQGGYFIHTDHFLSVRELVVPDWGFGISRPNDEEEHTSFQLGLVHWGAVAVGIGLLLWPPQRRLTVALLGLFLVSIGMTLPLSQWVWAQSGVLRALQFPWRFLLPGIVAASALMGAPVAALRRFPRLHVAVGLLVAGLCVTAYGKYRVAGLGSGPMPPTSRELLEAWAPDGLGRPEYLPAHTDWEPTRPPPAEVMTPRGSAADVEVRESLGHRLAFTVTAPDPTTVAVERFASPGWDWSASRPDVAVSVDVERGTFVVLVPAGVTQMTFTYGLTPLRRWTLWGSGVMLLALGIAWGMWPRFASPSHAASVANGATAE